GLARAVEEEWKSDQGVKVPEIKAVNRDQELPLSYAQQRLWFIQQLEPESVVYNIPYAVRIRGALNVTALRQSLDEIVRRHEVLRTRIVSHEGRPVQVIEEPGEIELQFMDVSGLVEREEQARDYVIKDGLRAFDLERGGVWRSGLVRLDAEEHVLLVCLHHV